jgi:hypothetical protein
MLVRSRLGTALRGMTTTLGPSRFGIFAICGLSTAITGAANQQVGDHAALGNLVRSAPISLEQGLRASESRGSPISGKFEIENGKFQLSVFTSRRDKFFEVIVNHDTGKIERTDAITRGDDLDAARAQRAVMAKAKRSLRDVTAQVASTFPDARVVSVVPELKDGHAIATLKLFQGKVFKTSTVPLE